MSNKILSQRFQLLILQRKNNDFEQESIKV